MSGFRRLSVALRRWRTVAEERRVLAQAVTAALVAAERAAPEVRAALRSPRGQADGADGDRILVAVDDWHTTWDLPPGWLAELRRREQIVVLVRVRDR